MRGNKMPVSGVAFEITKLGSQFLIVIFANVSTIWMNGPSKNSGPILSIIYAWWPMTIAHKTILRLKMLKFSKIRFSSKVNI